jgi:hypothetical protein
MRSQRGPCLGRSSDNRSCRGHVLRISLGTLAIKDSRLRNNPSGEFFTAGYPGIFVHSSGHPTVTGSTIN